MPKASSFSRFTRGVRHTVRAFAAFGAGGQSVTVVPELDLVVATLGGSYFSPRQNDITVNLVPRSVRPAVLEGGDPIDAPVNDREFTTPYGASKVGSRVLPGNR